MSIDEWKKIVDHQVKLILAERGMHLKDLTQYEKVKHQLDVALKLLEELG